MSKYHAHKTEYDGHIFDSEIEMKRYVYLREKEDNGEISQLHCQVKYELIPKTKTERAVTYRADFQYYEGCQLVAEDVKGYRTKDYIIKRKIFKWRFPHVEFREVYYRKGEWV